MSFKRNISYNLIAQLLSAVLTFVSSIYLTRILGAEGRGEYTIFTNASTFALLFFGFSIHSTLAFFLNSGRMNYNELITSSIGIILLSTFLVGVSLYVLQLFKITHLAFPDKEHIKTYALIFLLFFFANISNSVLISLYGALKLFKQSSVFMVLFILFPCVSYAGLYYLGGSESSSHPIEAVLLIVAANALLSLFSYYIVLWRRVPFQLRFRQLQWKTIQQLLLFTGIAYLANVAQFMTYKMDYWFMDHYYGKITLGVYSLASSLAQMLWIIPNSMGQVLYSEISSEPQTQALPRRYLRLAPAVMYITFFGALAGGILSYYLLPLLFGREFSQSFLPLIVFLPGCILFAHSTALASINAGRGRFKMNYYGSIIGFAMSILLYPFCISSYGMLGGAAASSLIYAVQVVYYTFSFARCEHVTVKELFLIRWNELLNFLPWRKSS